MGNLKIRFLSNGENIEETPYKIDKMGTVQFYQIKYNISKISEIEFNDDDFYIDFDINSLQDDIEWKQQNYPNNIVKDKVLEIVYYQDISNKLNKILKEINRCKFEDRDNLNHLGIQALKIIKETKDSVVFDSIKLNNNISIERINHTIGKEVKNLTLYTKDSDSNTKKNEALKEARDQLFSEINSFKLMLENYSVNSD